MDVHAHKRTLVHSIDLTVAPGEVVAIVGHNGAGKSTTMRGLAGLHRTSGRVLLGDQDLTHASPSARVRAGIALVPDGGKGVFGPLTVSANIALAQVGTKARDVPESVTTLVNSLAPFLVERADQLAASLSGGQRQMLALATVLLRSPRLLMLDEPSIGLAPKVVDDLLVGVRSAADLLKVGVILVEQDVGAAMSVADQVLVMKEGRIRERYDRGSMPDISELWKHF
jgi:branched-chain amino acid transport system ATP-binding protein